MTTRPSLQRLGLGLVLAILVSPGIARGGGPLLVNGAGTPLVWTASPIPYNPDLGPLGSLANADAVALVGSLFGVWEAVPSATVTVTDAGPLPSDVTASNYPSVVGICGDGLSPIVFDTDGSITDDLFGPGASDNILGFAGPECATFVPPVITEGLAVLNGKWIDGVPGTEIPQADFDSVFVHEFGHYLNLDHSQINLLEAFDGDPSNDDAIATMFPFLVNGAAAATLHLDDIVSVSTLYPAPTFATDFGSIIGSVFLADGVTPFQGAHVVARAIGDPRVTAVGMVSGARYFPFEEGGPPPSSLAGAFVIPGLPAGSYTVEIEEVFPGFAGGSSVGPLNPPAPLPGVPEFYNGADEAGTSPPDDPSAFTPVTVSAGTVASEIDVVINGFPPAPNDACAAPTVIATLPYSDTVETSGATTEPADPLPSCGDGSQGSHSVWYVLTAPEDGLLRATTAGSNYDTVVTAHTGACGALAEIGCSDDAGGSTSDLRIPVTAGQAVLLEVTSYGSFAGTLRLAVDILHITTYQGTYPDPAGDTIGSGSIQLDLTGLSVCRTAADLRVRLDFATPIAPWTSGAPNALGGYVDLDIDEDATTGIPPLTDLFTGAITGLGTDLYIDLFSSASDGSILVVNPFFGPVGMGVATFDPTSLSISIPLSVLNDDGHVRIAAIVGTSFEPTDGAPPDGNVASVPCSGVPSCTPAPRAACKKPVLSAKATFKVADKLQDRKDGFQWKWAKGAGTLKPDFGDPTTTTGYSLCVYDEIAGSPALVMGIDAPPAGTCNNRPCWSRTTSGWKYRSTTNPDGLQQLELKEGVDGRATIVAKGKGETLPLPTLPFAQTVTVQLLNLDGFCWDAEFSAPAADNDAGGFSDKGD
jgi:hypothetical protein